MKLFTLFFLIIFFIISLFIGEFWLKRTGLGSPISYDSDLMYGYAPKENQRKKRLKSSTVTINESGLRSTTSWIKSKKKKMPLIRLIGAKSLTVLTRINSGYWELHDPCHGLIGFNYKILKKINLRKIKFNYFFEQDIIMNVVKFNGSIKQFKNEVVYGNESSKLNPLMSIIPFLYYHIIIFLKKILKI